MSKQEELANKQTKDNDMDYAIEWYRYGIDKGDDLIIKFMMHWIAFSWLFGEARRGTERANTNKYCNDNYNKLKKYNPFYENPEAVRVFKEGPISSDSEITTVRDPEQIHDDICNGRRARRVKSLILAIYQVRCNLFHGSKRLHMPRDLELVHSSAIILEGYLKVLLPPNV